MTYGNMVDLVRAEQKTQCELRRLPYIKIGLALLYQLISQSEEEIQRRIQVLTNYEPLDLDEGATYADESDIVYADESGIYYVSNSELYVYDTPDDYGNLISLTVDGVELEYIAPHLFYVDLDKRTETVYTTTAQDGKNLVKFGPTAPLTTEEVVPNYYTSIRPFREREITGSTNLVFPNQYQDLVKLGVMKVIFSDYFEQFERGIRSHKEFRNSQGLDELPGQVVGGIPNG